MRISICYGAEVYFKDGSEPIFDEMIFAHLQNWKYKDEPLYYYLDAALVDVGIIGGIIRINYKSTGKLQIVVDYWAPSLLAPLNLQLLQKFTSAQLVDGIGEGGFNVTLNEIDYLIVPDIDEMNIEQTPDNTVLKLPSKVVRSARDGKLDELNQALASGDEIDATIQGYSALHFSILYGYSEIALQLISKGANPNLRDKDGNTPLHLCALSNSLSDKQSALVAIQLIQCGGEKKIFTPDGKSVEFFADSRGKSELLKILQA